MLDKVKELEAELKMRNESLEHLQSRLLRLSG